MVPAAAEDARWMELALEQAALARERGEVPVGAVLVVADQVVAAGCNRTIMDCDPSAHAEIVTLRAAGSALANHRTAGTMYVTLEPCLMCMGALVQARLDALVYGASDPKAGAAQSLYAVAADERLNHRFPVRGGVLADRCGGMLQAFFAERRG